MTSEVGHGIVTMLHCIVTTYTVCIYIYTSIQRVRERERARERARERESTLLWEREYIVI